jgi:spore germination protein AB
MNSEINKAFQISPFLVFYLIHSVQVGVGILGFQQALVKKAGNDAWISVLLAGLAVHIMIWFMYLLLNRANMNLIDIHKYVFGKWLGGLISLFWVLYFTFTGMTVLFSYFEVIRVWMFPDISVFWLTVVFLFMVFYTIIGGFRTVTGICFLGTVIPSYLILTLIFPLEYTEFRTLLPIFNHTMMEIGLATYEMTFSFLGFSTILIYYPFIKQAKSSQKWAHLGAILTTVVYLLFTVISLTYYSENQLIKQVWATLTLWKIVEMPFVERFEYIGIVSWSLIILPNLCLFFWSASRGMKQIFNMKHRIALLIILLFVLIASFFFKGREEILTLGQWTSKVGFVTDFLYIPILFFLYLIVEKVKGKQK